VVLIITQCVLNLAAAVR